MGVFQKDILFQSEIVLHRRNHLGTKFKHIYINQKKLNINKIVTSIISLQSFFFLTSCVCT